MIHNSSLARYGYAARNKKVLSCFLNSPVSRVDLISTGSLFHAFGAATSKALSEETSLVLGTSSSCLPTERSDARPGIAATGVTNSFSTASDIFENQEQKYSFCLNT